MTTYSQYAETIRPVSMYNDVWYSEDGSQWYEATADIDKDDPELIWRARAGAIALVKGGWLYILGGERAFLSGPHAAIFFHLRR